MRLRGLLPPLPTAKCGICGSEFTPKVNRHGAARFCPACSKKHGRQKCERILAGNVYKTCEHCGESFEATHGQQKYCSPECKEARRLADPIDRQKRLARGRSWYHERGGREYLAGFNRQPEVMERRRIHSRLYRTRHPDKVAEFDNRYRNKRNKRIAEQSDGTAGGMVAKLVEKRIDHRDPVSMGGHHSAANLELCCDPCNTKKLAMPFAEWVAMLTEPFRSKAIARAEKARGAPLIQEALPLFGGLAIRKKKDNAVDQVIAKAEALAAWRRWLYEMAPNEWLDGYYASHPKPWTDHRLTSSQSFMVRYRADPAFARRWKDARNANRRQKRAEARMSQINGRFFLGPKWRVASREESN